MSENAIEPYEAKQPAHHIYGMSRWPAMLACPCYDPKEGGEYAAMGTNVHAVLEAALKQWIKTGELPEETDEMTLHEKGALYAARTVTQMMTDEGLPRDRLFSETRCSYPDNTVAPWHGIFGTADVAFFDPSKLRLTVADFKTAHNPGRDYTAQLMGYALAIGERLPVRPSEYRLMMLYGDRPSANSYQIFDGRTLENLRLDVWHNIVQHLNNTGTPKQCAWCTLCDHAGTCPAYRAIAEGTQRTPWVSAGEEWGTWAADRKAQAVLLAETVEAWAKEVKALAKQTLLDGGTVADELHGIGYKLVTRKGRKTPRLADAAPMLLGKGVTQHDLKSVLTISATSCKALLKDVGVKGKEADTLIDEVSDHAESTTSMARC